MLPIVRLNHLDGGAHVRSQRVHAHTPSQRHDGIEVAKAVERVLLAFTAVREPSLLQCGIELVNERHDCAPISHGEEQVVWMGSAFAAEHAIDKSGTPRAWNDLALSCLPVDQKAVVSPAQLVLEGDEISDLERVCLPNS